MKIGLIGIGYWGKIILKVLQTYTRDIIICDEILKNNSKYEIYNTITDYKDLECDKVFVAVPATKHYIIVKYFLEKGIDVFCEKPLTIDHKTSNELYKIANENNALLIVDWIFTFNPYINKIKTDYDSGLLGKIKSVNMNRLNFGPERTDVNAKWDLASHDISIIQYIFNDTPIKIIWHDYKKNKESHKEDSTLGFIEYTNFTSIINASWYYRKKVRECVFEFDKCFVIWDDDKKRLDYIKNDDIIITNVDLSKQPLNVAIETFLDNYTKEHMRKQEKLTSTILEILQNEY